MLMPPISNGICQPPSSHVDHHHHQLGHDGNHFGCDNNDSTTGRCKIFLSQIGGKRLKRNLLESICVCVTLTHLLNFKEFYLEKSNKWSLANVRS